MKNQVNLLYIYIYIIIIFVLIKWNKFVPNFMQAFIVSIVFIYESKNNKIYPMRAMFYQWPQIPRNFKTLYIAIGGTLS
jgi:hypothetical protein